MAVYSIDAVIPKRIPRKQKKRIYKGLILYHFKRRQIVKKQANKGI